MDQTTVAPRPESDPVQDPALDAPAVGHPGPAPSITLTSDDLAAIEGLQALHAQRTVTGAQVGDMPTGSSDVDLTQIDPTGTTGTTDSAADVARCPIPAALTGGATACPVGAGTTRRPVTRSKADNFVRRLLRISDTPRDLGDAATYKAFRRSMMISAVRCTLTYVVFPLVLPMLSFATGVGSVIGVIIGTFALVCDTFVIRRFFAVDHRYRWQLSAIVLSIMGLLTVLLVQDLAHIVQSLTA